MKQIHRKTTIQNSDASLCLFDIIPFENFKKGMYDVSYTKRSKTLLEWYDKNVVQNEKIKVIDKKIVNLDEPNGLAEFKSFNKEALMNGNEGIMIKDPDSFYECKRSTTWLKSKPFIEISLQVKNVEEGTGRNIGKLGAVIAEGEDDGKFFKLNIGSGFTDEQRLNYWKKENLIGQIIEVRADSISKVKMDLIGAYVFQDLKHLGGLIKVKKFNKVLVLGVIILGAVFSCETNEDKKLIGGLIGAAIGAYVGSEVGSGIGKNITTVIGGSLGYMLGTKIANILSEEEELSLNQKISETLDKNENQEKAVWSSKSDKNKTAIITPLTNYELRYHM